MKIVRYRCENCGYKISVIGEDEGTEELKISCCKTPIMKVTSEEKIIINESDTEKGIKWKKKKK